MAKQVEYTIGPITTAMRTKTDARECAERRAAEALDGDYSPYHLDLFGATLIVWREPMTGWSYKIIHPEDKAEPGHTLRPCVYYPDDEKNNRRSVVFLAVEHLTDLYWDRDPESLPDSPIVDIAIVAEIQYRDTLRSDPVPC